MTLGAFLRWGVPECRRPVFEILLKISHHWHISHVIHYHWYFYSHLFVYVLKAPKYHISKMRWYVINTLKNKKIHKILTNFFQINQSALCYQLLHHLYHTQKFSVVILAALFIIHWSVVSMCQLLKPTLFCSNQYMVEKVFYTSILNGFNWHIFSNT